MTTEPQTDAQQDAALELMRQQRAEIDSIAVNAVAVVKAATAFVEWHLKGQPKTPGTFYPMTYAQQEAWHNEWDNRLETLIWAVSILGHA